MRLKATCSSPGFPKFFCVFLNFLVSKLFLTCLIQLPEKIEGEYSKFFAENGLDWSKLVFQCFLLDSSFF